MARQKIILQRAALKRGWPFFIGQAVKSVRDTVWSQRHLIYVLSASEGHGPLENARHPNFTFRMVTDRSQLSDETQELLAARQEELGWGSFASFDLGWTMSLLEIDGRLAAFGFWRTSGQSDDFYYEIPEGAILLWQTTVLPEYRSGRLLDTLLNHVSKQVFEQGVAAVYGSCRDFNYTSINMLERNGWKCRGYVEVNKISGSRKFRPVTKA